MENKNSQSLNRRLKYGHLVFFGIVYMAPFTVITYYGLIESMTHGMMSLAYIVATVAMAFTGYSYSKMVKAYPVAGSVYTYTQKSINPHVGFMSGWAMLMDYILLPMLTCVIAALFLKLYFPTVPSFVWIIAYIGVATLINIFGISFTAWTGNIMSIAQLAFLIALIFFIINAVVNGDESSSLFDIRNFYNKAEFAQIGGMNAIFSGAAILALSFLGFDALTTLSEETIEPEKNIGRAIFTVCVGMGIFFAIISYFMQAAWPNNFNEFTDADSGGQELIIRVGGNALGYVFIVLTSLASLANIVATQTSAARLLYGMGRDGALPKKFFAYISPKRQVPMYNLFLLGAVALISIFMDLNVASSLVNFGALLGFVLVNLSVVFHYFIRGKQRSGLDIVRYLIIPLIGAAICATVWWSLDVSAKVVGFIWLFIGIVILAVVTKGFKTLPPDMKMDD